MNNNLNLLRNVLITLNTDKNKKFIKHVQLINANFNILFNFVINDDDDILF